MKKIFLLITLLYITGCFGGSSPNSIFYKISSQEVATEERNNQIKKSIGIDSVIIPNYLNRPQIVTKDAANYELTISEFNRWGENLSGMLQRTIAEDLAQLMPKAQVKPRVNTIENFDYLVRVEIMSFDGTFDETANLKAWWSVFDAEDNLLVRKQAKLSVALQGDYNDYAAQQSLLVMDLSKEIAKSIKELKK